MDVAHTTDLVEQVMDHNRNPEEAFISSFLDNMISTKVKYHVSVIHGEDNDDTEVFVQFAYPLTDEAVSTTPIWDDPDYAYTEEPNPVGFRCEVEDHYLSRLYKLTGDDSLDTTSLTHWYDEFTDELADPDEFISHQLREFITSKIHNVAAALGRGDKFTARRMTSDGESESPVQVHINENEVIGWAIHPRTNERIETVFLIQGLTNAK